MTSGIVHRLLTNTKECPMFGQLGCFLLRLLASWWDGSHLVWGTTCCQLFQRKAFVSAFSFLSLLGPELEVPTCHITKYFPAQVLQDLSKLPMMDFNSFCNPHRP